MAVATIVIRSGGGLTARIVERGPAGPGMPLDGQPGQIVGYDENGNPAALDPSAASIPAGAEGQVLGYGPGGVPQAVDAPARIDLGTFN